MTSPYQGQYYTRARLAQVEGHEVRAGSSATLPQWPSQVSLPLEAPTPPEAPTPSGDPIPPICSALVMRHMEADFSIPAESLRNLVRGMSPESILGPSGAALLHARLTMQPAVGLPAALPGVWMELSSTLRVKTPHACIGPLQLGEVAERPLEIRGSNGNVYGTLQQSAFGWTVSHRGGQMLLSMEQKGQGSPLALVDGLGRTFAKATSLNGDSLRVQVDPGADVVLAILTMLAVILMKPDVAWLRMR